MKQKLYTSIAKLEKWSNDGLTDDLSLLASNKSLALTTAAALLSLISPQCVICSPVLNRPQHRKFRLFICIKKFRRLCLICIHIYIYIHISGIISQ